MCFKFVKPRCARPRPDYFIQCLYIFSSNLNEKLPATSFKKINLLIHSALTDNKSSAGSRDKSNLAGKKGGPPKVFYSSNWKRRNSSYTFFYFKVILWWFIIKFLGIRHFLWSPFLLIIYRLWNCLKKYVKKIRLAKLYKFEQQCQIYVAF